MKQVLSSINKNNKKILEIFVLNARLHMIIDVIEKSGSEKFSFSTNNIQIINLTQ